MRRDFFLGFIILLFWSPLAHSKEKKEETIPVPPFPISSHVQVFMDQPKKIALKASGRIEEPIKFLIRKKPLRGSLGEIRFKTPKIAFVEYIPDKGTRPGEDFFTYAAQSIDSPVSVAATIRIDLLPRPPALSYPRTLDFGEVPVGDSACREIFITNAGGKDASLGIRAKTPWKLAEPVPDIVPSGGEAVVTLFFEPLALGDYNDKLSLTLNEVEFVRLQGTAVDILSWPVKGLEISSEMRAHAQSIDFTNKTDTARTLTIDWPETLRATRKIELPPEKTVSVSVEVPPEAPPAFQYRGDVSFRSNQFSATFPLVIHPAPPRLVINPENILALCEVPLGDPAVGNFTVSNTGGESAEVGIQLPKEHFRRISIRPDPSSVDIGPGTDMIFQISIQTPEVGEFSYPLDIFCGDKPIGRLNVQTTVRANARAALPVEKLLDLPLPAPAIPSGPHADIPEIKELSRYESTPHTVAISWKVPAPLPKEFFIERREIRPSSNGSPESWVRWESASIEVHGDTATANFSKLPAGTFWNIRIRAVDSEGLVSAPRRGFFRIETKRLPPLLPNLFWWVIGPVVVLLLSRLWKKIREDQHDDLDDRIHNLGKK